MDITHITSLLGGVALFLYGMSIMGAGLEKLAGGKMQGVLQKLTSSTIKGVIFGTLITGVIQSSAGTVVICVGLVNSGIMTLTQSVGVIMGANIGTTVTGQLIRMADISGDSLWLTLIQPKTFAPVVAFIGCIFYVFLRNAKKKNIGQIMLGFGILFTGMSLMDTGVAPLRESAVFQNLFVTMTNPILGVLVGVVVTVIIQSSSASVGILQALSSTGLVTFSSAIPIILGAHIGTAFTPLLTIGGSSKDGKRAALIHLYFNVIGSEPQLQQQLAGSSRMGHRLRLLQGRLLPRHHQIPAGRLRQPLRLLPGLQRPGQRPVHRLRFGRLVLADLHRWR